MHEREIKVLWRGGLLLAAASLFRLGAGSSFSASLPSGPSVLDSLTAKSTAAALEEERRARPLEPGERVDPNGADATDLARLPGIGPALAQRIVDHRTTRGSFTTLGDLQEVRGIGPRLLERIAQSVTLTPAPQPPRASQRVVQRARDAATRTPATTAEVLSALNRATAAEFERLPGIGSALASRILDVRARVGRFQRASDLLQVSGIGPRRLAAIEQVLPSWAARVGTKPRDGP